MKPLRTEPFSRLRRATVVAAAMLCATRARCQPADQPADRELPVEAERAPAGLWTPRLERLAARLRRAARGSGIRVEPLDGKLRVRAFGDESFAANRSEPHATLRAFLDELAEHGEDRHWVQAEVIGHARRGGAVAATERLALARAAAVERQLSARGIRIDAPARAMQGLERGVDILLSDPGP